MRSEIIEAAIRGIREFADTTRGARVIKNIKKEDDHSFTVVYRDGELLHFSTSLV